MNAEILSGSNNNDNNNKSDNSDQIVQSVEKIDSVVDSFQSDSFDLAQFSRKDVIFKDDYLKVKILTQDLIPEKSFVYPKTGGRKFLFITALLQLTL